MEDPSVNVNGRPIEADETHHVADRTVDGDHRHGMSWDADWLNSSSELPRVFAITSVRSEPVWPLAALDTAYADSAPATPRSQWCAQQSVEHLGAKEDAQ